MRLFVSKLVKAPLVLPAGGIISLTMSQLASLPDEFVYSLGIPLSATTLFYDAYMEWKMKKKEIEQNYLYFYYRTQQRLSK